MIGTYEAVSFLLLLFVAMPLKYLAGQALAVRVVGMAHGILFLAYCAALIRARQANDLALKECFICFVAALLPFGPFAVDKRLKRIDDRSEGN